MPDTDRDTPVTALLRAMDLIGHDIHAAFWGGVATEHNTQPGSDEPFGDCYKCRIVADKLRESAARHGVILASSDDVAGSGERLWKTAKRFYDATVDIRAVTPYRSDIDALEAEWANSMAEVGNALRDAAPTTQAPREETPEA